MIILFYLSYKAFIYIVYIDMKVDHVLPSYLDVMLNIIGRWSRWNGLIYIIPNPFYLSYLLIYDVFASYFPVD